MFRFDIRVTLQLLFSLTVASILIICIGTAFNLTNTDQLIPVFICLGGLGSILGLGILFSEM